MGIAEKFYDQVEDKIGMVSVAAGVIASVAGGVIVKDAFEDSASNSVPPGHVRYEAVNQVQTIIDAQMAAQKREIQSGLDNGDPEIKINLGTNTITIQRKQIDQNFNEASGASKVVLYTCGTTAVLFGLGMIGLGVRALRQKADEQKKASVTSIEPI